MTFECEEDAKRAYRHLREEVQCFKGRPLMARIKAKTFLSRSVYLPKNSSNPTVISSRENTAAPYTVSNQPITATSFGLPPNAVFHNAQEFQYYATSSVNGGSFLPATWVGPRNQLINPHEVITQYS